MNNSGKTLATANRPKRTTWGRRVAVVLFAAGLALGAGACGSGGGGSSSPTTTTTSPSGY